MTMTDRETLKFVCHRFCFQISGMSWILFPNFQVRGSKLSFALLLDIPLDVVRYLVDTCHIPMASGLMRSPGDLHPNGPSAMPVYRRLENPEFVEKLIWYVHSSHHCAAVSVVPSVAHWIPDPNLTKILGGTATSRLRNLHDTEECLSCEPSTSNGRTEQVTAQGGVKSDISVFRDGFFSCIRRLPFKWPEEVMVVVCDQNSFMLELDSHNSPPIVYVDSPSASMLASLAAGSPKFFETICMLGATQMAALMTHGSPRVAMHLVASAWEVLGKPVHDQVLEGMQKLSGACPFDAGHVWETFLRNAAGVTEAERSSQDAAYEKRDKLVSWLLANQLIELPYNHTAMCNALHSDLSRRPTMCHSVLSKYDVACELRNVMRVSNFIREDLIPRTTAATPILLVGRESRAFGNQAYLMASSKLVLPDENLISSAQTLFNISDGAELRKDLFSVIPPNNNTAFNLVVKLTDLLVHLGPGVGRLKSLVSRKEPHPLTQYCGVLQTLHHQLEIIHTESRIILDKEVSRVVLSLTDYAFRTLQDCQHLQDYRNSLMLLKQRMDRYSGISGDFASAITSVEDFLPLQKTISPAFSVLLQRISPNAAEKFKANEIEDKPEQEPALRKLVRIGGDRVYMSASFEWISEATDIVEAVPLFIYEHTVEREGISKTEFHVDQEGLEATVRQMAPNLAENIRRMLSSLHVSLAREVVCHAVSVSLEQLKLLVTENGLDIDSAVLTALKECRQREVSLVALWISIQFEKRVEEIEEYVEQQWCTNNYVDLLSATRSVLVQPNAKLLSPSYSTACEKLVAQVCNSEISNDSTGISKYTPILWKRQRPLPAFHLLTTEAPGLMEAFIQTVLEEQMALENIILAYGLESEVKLRSEKYAGKLLHISRHIISEFGYEPLLKQYLAKQNCSEATASFTLIQEHTRVQEEVAILAVLVDTAFSLSVTDMNSENWITECISWIESECTKLKLQEPSLMLEIECISLQHVLANNLVDPVFSELNEASGSKPSASAVRMVVMRSPEFLMEFKSNISWQLRRHLLHSLDKRHPELCLERHAKHYIRNRTVLTRTLAARELIKEKGLAPLMLSPLYAYGSGVVDQRDGHAVPVGRRKRYHLIYAPSRVNLGKGELMSVQQWPQWAGVSDPLAASHAKHMYEHINYHPVIHTIRETENLKVSENQWTALIRAVRNCQALFVDREGVGDIELLEYEYAQRDGLAAASRKLKENYSAGPTAGYCIPKDLLFKMFVVTFQDESKLEQIGVSAHLHASTLSTLHDILDRRPDFRSVAEWEKWAATLLQPESINSRLLGSNLQTSHSIQRFNSCLGNTSIVYHLPKLSNLLPTVGVPNPRTQHGRDLAAVVWSSWAEKKISLGGEQVNRSLVFGFVRGIFRAARMARSLNPLVPVAQDERLHIHVFGTYKGDEDYPAPPDVRFAMSMRLFMILSGHSHEVALCLDEEGQVIAHLLTHGLKLQSQNAMDKRAASMLASHFVGKNEFDSNEDARVIEALMKEFPPMPSVADITITSVPGVTTEDLLGFNAETKALLSNDAKRALELLKTYGINTEQMRANARLHKKFPEEWAPLNKLSTQKIQFLKEEVGYSIHPLVLQLRGPGSNFRLDLQAQDIVLFCCPHMQMMSLTPTELRDLMLLGNPTSALVALDFVVQGKKRVWCDRDVMSWYAACRGIDAQGNEIENWDEREIRGRRGSYLAFGKGIFDVESSLGMILYDRVGCQEKRAIKLYKALENVVNSKPQAYEEFLSIFTEEFSIAKSSSVRQEMEWACDYEQQVILKGRFQQRDTIIRQVLENIVYGMPAKSFGALEWLATGGMYLLNGLPALKQQRILEICFKAISVMNGKPLISNSDSDKISHLIRPQSIGASFKWAEQKGEMFSVKASEQVKETAVARRRALIAASRMQATAEQLSQGVLSCSNLHFPETPHQLLQFALSTTREIVESLRNSSRSFSAASLVGKLLGLCPAAIDSITDLLPLPHKTLVKTYTKQLTDESGLKIEVWKKFSGTYEDQGLLSEMFDACSTSSENEELVLSLCEILYTALLMWKTLPFLTTTTDNVGNVHLWRALAEFFAETIDDHYSEYNPWYLDHKRCSHWHRLYDTLGFLKPETSEILYQLAWKHHRYMYFYVRTLILEHTAFSAIPSTEAEVLLGDVVLGNSLSGEEDVVRVVGIGAGHPPGYFETLWRAYNHLREFAFMANDGFSLPVVACGVDPQTLNCTSRVNHVFLYPVGRTHISRALSEGPTMGANLLVTRDGCINSLPKSEDHRPLVCISDAHTWLRFDEAVMLLHTSRNITQEQARDYLLASNYNTSKGVRFAITFSDPVWAGSVCCFHHHRLEKEVFTTCGYPSTDKSRVLFELTYNKSLYPSIYTVPGSGVELPPEIDWMLEHTTKFGSNDAEAIVAISQRLREFAQRHFSIIAKGAAESGARNLQRFDLVNRNSGVVDEQQLVAASKFVYTISKTQNVTIQRAIITTPFSWMDSQAIERFVERQQTEWGAAVQLHVHPKDAVYGTLRVIMSCGMPNSCNLHDPANWTPSHILYLCSTQVATNVGRQGTLEVLDPKFIQPAFRESFITGLVDAARNSMVAVSRFGHHYWHNCSTVEGVTLPSYHELHPEDPECDSSGIPYWWPRYLMLDFLPEPIFATQDGKILHDVQILDVCPGRTLIATQTHFVIQTPGCPSPFIPRIAGFRFWLLEPNVGIGLWPNYWKREVCLEQEMCVQQHRETNWGNVGVSDRIVLSNFLLAGAAFMKSRGISVPPCIPVRNSESTSSQQLSTNVQDTKGLFLSALQALHEQLPHVKEVGPLEFSILLVELAYLYFKEQFSTQKISNSHTLELVKRWVESEEAISQIFEPTVSKLPIPIALSKSALLSFLGDPVYTCRIAEIVLDRFKSVLLTPPTALLPHSCESMGQSTTFSKPNIVAVVTGKRSLMSHHLFPWCMRQSTDTLVIGVHTDWLTPDAKASRIITYDPAKSLFIELALAAPLRFTHTYVVELPASTELIDLTTLCTWFDSVNIKSINPLSSAIERAADKTWLMKNASLFSIPVPLSGVVSKAADIGRVIQELSSLSRSEGIIIKAAKGTTEGATVQWFASTDAASASNYAERLLSRGDIIISKYEGSVTYQGCPLVLRFNVACTGTEWHTTCSPVIGAKGEKVAVLGKIPAQPTMSTVLRNLQVANTGTTVSITETEFNSLTNIAKLTANKISLPLVGIDVVLVHTEAGIQGRVLEANARPGSLIFAETVQFTPQGIVSSPAQAIPPSFFLS
ncbi:hypothetical protein Pelo_14398 [Pelomyxa schiedti]|nr:hypothetical protein Pelo_14398 [Pelomyxa schiedti]